MLGGLFVSTSELFGEVRFEREGFLEANVDAPELELDDAAVEDQAGERFLLLGVAKQPEEEGVSESLEMARENSLVGVGLGLNHAVVLNRDGSDPAVTKG